MAKLKIDTKWPMFRTLNIPRKNVKGHSTSVVLRLFSTFKPLNSAYYIENDI